jgi:hypothetical protein
MSRRSPREARILGLWTAAWLGVLLLAGLLRVGDVRVQWPVLAVPLLWALIALRPRRRGRRDEDEDAWEPIPPSGAYRPELGARTDTVERPALRNRDGDERRR